MKATGIVRRIDDLGRVVIPKEIRRVMRIRDGDPLEIYTAVDGEVIFKKYSPIGELTGIASEYAEVLSKDCAYGIVICDRDHAVAASGISKKDTLDRRVSSELERLMDARQTYFRKAGEHEKIKPFDGLDNSASIIVPIIAAGDISGAVVALDLERSKAPSEVDLKLCRVAAAFLGRQMEE